MLLMGKSTKTARAKELAALELKVAIRMWRR
jgi:hypothetical protein